MHVDVTLEGSDEYSPLQTFYVFESFPFIIFLIDKNTAFSNANRVKQIFTFNYNFIDFIHSCN
jgi:hypothetical protein